MNKEIFLIGVNEVPSVLQQVKSFSFQIISNPYTFKAEFGNKSQAALVIIYLDFIDRRHYDFYSQLKASWPSLQMMFLVEQISESMMSKLRYNHDFMIFWQNEEDQLLQNIKNCLRGRELYLRQEPRNPTDKKALMSLMGLPGQAISLAQEKLNFRPMLPGQFENISIQGSCLKLQAPYYEPKDFVNLTFQNQDGEFINVQGQVRWVKWDAIKCIQEIGLHFVSTYRFVTA